MKRGPDADPTLAATRSRADAAGEQAAIDPGVIIEPTTLNGVPAIRFRPEGADDDRVVLWFHGGGYRLGSAGSFRSWNSGIAARSGIEVVSVDYRLAPEHPFPDALIDAALAYAAVSNGGHRRVAVGGESAGGGLAAAVLHLTAERGLPRPVAGVFCSPWLDVSNSAASFADGTDALFPRSAADAAAALYLAGHPVTDPYASPLYGPWSDAPPLLVQASSGESLRDDAVRLVTAAGDRARLQLFDDVLHAWHIGYPAAPQSIAAADSIAVFLDEVIPRKAVAST